jgi:hypothetical protein
MGQRKEQAAVAASTVVAALILIQKVTRLIPVEAAPASTAAGPTLSAKEISTFRREYRILYRQQGARVLNKRGLFRSIL